MARATPHESSCDQASPADASLQEVNVNITEYIHLESAVIWRDRRLRVLLQLPNQLG
jgi:hypothetical protein